MREGSRRKGLALEGIPTPHLLVWALLLAVVLACPLAPGEAHAKRQGGDPAARKLYQAGREHLAEGRYPDAEQAFRKAYILDPSPVFLNAIGVACKEQGKIVKAMKSFERFLEQAKEAPKRDRKRVQATLKSLRRLAAKSMRKVLIESEPSGAAVYVDSGGEPVGKTPVTRWLSFGTRSLRLTHDGHLPLLRKLKVSKAKPAKIRYELVADDAPGAIVLKGTLDGVRVEIDGAKPVPAPADGKVPVPAGRHTVRITAEGHAPFVAAVQVAPGASAEIGVELIPLPSSKPVAGEAPPAAEEQKSGDTEDSSGAESGSRVRWPFWATVGVGGVAVLAGGGFQWAAVKKADEAQDLSGQAGKTVEWDAADSDSRRYATYAAAGFAVAGVAVVGAAVLYVLGADPEETLSAEETPSAVLLVPLLGPDGLGASVVGRF